MPELEYLLIFTELVYMCRKLTKSNSLASFKAHYVPRLKFTHLIGYSALENYL